MKKKPKVAIIDISINNILSIKRAMDFVGFETTIVQEKFNTSLYDLIILPGVGSFNEGMKRLTLSKLIHSVNDAINKEIELLGICLGMQLLFKGSYEFGYTKGIGFFEKDFLPFNNTNAKKILIGWNEVFFNKKNNFEIQKYIFRKKLNKDKFYFVHSYYVDIDEKKYEIAYSVNNKTPFSSIVRKNKVTAFQFHPEKSGDSGIQLLNFFYENT